MKHSLVFDGTSYYVTDHDTAKNDNDLQIIKSADDFDLLSDQADTLNEEV